MTLFVLGSQIVLTYELACCVLTCQSVVFAGTSIQVWVEEDGDDDDDSAL